MRLRSALRSLPFLLPASARLELALLAWILFLGAVLRFSYLDLVEFKADEATMLNLALDWLDNGRWPGVGIASSKGLSTSPVMVYLVALPLFFQRDAAFVTGFIGLLNLGAIVATYLFTRRYFGPGAALTAAFLLASGFWTLMLTRKAWDVALLPLLSVLFLAAVFRVVVDGRRWAAAWALLWLGLLVQFHWSALAYVPLALTIGVLTWRAWWHPASLVGAGLFALAFVPWLAGEFQRGFASLPALLETGGGPTTYDLSALDLARLALTGEGFHALLGRAAAGYDPGLAALGAPAVLEGLALLGLAVAAVRAVSGFRFQVSWLLLLLWAVVPLLFFVRHSFPLYLPYVLQLFPAAYIATAVGLASLCRWLAGFPGGPVARALPFVAGLFLAAHGGVQVARYLSVMQEVARADTHGGYDVPLRFPQDAVRWLAEHPAARPSPVLVVAGEAIHPVLQFLTWGRFPSQPVMQDEWLPLPAAGATYLLGSEHSRAGLALAQSTENGPLLRFPYPGDRDAFAIYRTAQPDAEQVIAASGLEPLAGGSFADGVRILGFHLDPEARAGEALSLALLWQVQQAPPAGRSYRFFNHLTSPSGATIAQADGIGFETAGWRPGDLALSWFTLDVPSSTPTGLYTLRSGLYDLLTLARSPLDGSASDSLPVATARILAPAELLPFATTPPIASWGDGIQLANFELPLQTAAGQSIPIALLWRADATPHQDYTVFLHLTDPTGAVVAQSDAYPSGGAAPTGAWRPGELVADSLRLALPADLPPGTTLKARLGLYTLPSLRRLPVTGVAPASGLEAGPDEVRLGTVTIGP
ncbi:MAG: hypothetical protein HYY05_07985 [Chloroflexi bacterium]|nr:hypothetical protein [Chloroflexota bacterium]